ncbi:MAG: pallilysin-related adhesin [Treponema sp.]|nr:pallilysin-related adhesin [Treponema sp.]
MNRRILLIIATCVFILCAIGAVFFALGGSRLIHNQKKTEQNHTKTFVLGETDGNSRTQDTADEAISTEDNNSKAPMGEGEEIVSVLNLDTGGDTPEEQIIAFRNLHEVESSIHIALNEYDEKSRKYVRTWSAPALAVRPGTVSLYSRDLIGDRSTCVLLSGMNNQGEHTLTVFRRSGQNTLKNRSGNSASQKNPPLIKIAELQIDGAINIQETERSQAYQLGQAPGQSFTIAAYGHDNDSGNILDQIETIYSYDPQSGMYEKSKVTRIPGSQIEQRRLKDLLSGTPGVFEDFINDLWYFVSPQGTIDKKQYIYFDPVNHEIIFYGDENLQVFTWKSSIPTRYGLYISSQNISVSTLSRSINIELESLDSIRVKVFEEVRLKIGVNESWDGSYRRAGSESRNTANADTSVQPYINTVYDSSLGRFRFMPGGLYELSSGNTKKTGWYVFFEVNGQELLQLRSDMGNTPNEPKDENARIIYRVDRSPASGAPAGIISLSRIILGTTGIQDLHEGVITLTEVTGNSD